MRGVVTTYLYQSIKFMISCSKGKIDAHKAAGMILNSKSDYFINAFAMILSVGVFYAPRTATIGAANKRQLSI
ncbi:hypothetical protein CXF72_03120 [Psychromonas sp. MB-3u-54]|nr:hypothetical protein CXF72_03120 [Psychromonas sp. MB-3u-54]